MIAERSPKHIGIFNQLTAQLFTRRLYTRRCAGQPQQCDTITPRGRRNRQRLSGPFVEALDCGRLIHRKSQRHFGWRFRQHFERKIEQYPQCTHRARHQTRDVVACHVFDHAPAKSQVFSVAVDDARTQHEVTYRTGVRAARTGQSARNGPADGRAFGKIRRFKRQHLKLLGHRRFYFGKPGACAYGQYQFLGLVVDDAVIRARIECIADDIAAVERFRISAMNCQRRLEACRLLHTVDQRLNDCVHTLT